MRLNVTQGATVIVINLTTHEWSDQNEAFAIKLNDDLQHYIKQKLGLYWSPEQISGRLRMEDNIRISTETIYLMILKDQAAGGSLVIALSVSAVFSLYFRIVHYCWFLLFIRTSILDSEKSDC